MSEGAMVPQTGLKGTGVLVPVVCSHAVAKNSLIASVAVAFAGRTGIVFPACIKAVPHPVPGSGDILSPSEFDRLAAAGGFAADWRDDNGRIGLPMSVFDDLGAGRVVVVGVSRAVIPQLRDRHSRVHVVYLAEHRHRVRQDAVKSNISLPSMATGFWGHDPQSGLPDPPITVIDNSGPLSEAVEELIGVLQSYVPVFS